MLLPASESSRSQHIPALDGWRGLAVASVLLGHFGLDQLLPGVSSLGVDLFFVLSGRLMADILFVRRMPLPMFFGRRFARVYPALLAFAVVAGLLFPYLQPGYTLASVAFALTFTLNYAVAGGFPFTMFDHIWSLCVEEHSYVLLGLLALICRSMRRVAVAGIILVIGLSAMASGIVQLDILHHDPFHVLWRTDVALASIFISAAFFLLFKSHASWLTPCALSAAVLARFCGPTAALSFGAEIILLAIAVVGIEHATLPFRAILESRTFRSLGRCSFSIYLWQEPFYKLIWVSALPRPVLLFVALACGLLSYFFIERPARSALNAILGRRLRARQAVV